jgi:ABC-2 type transport system ATP-binding protein
MLVLNKGIVLYSGSVHGMSSNEGFFELQGRFRNLDPSFKTHPAIESIKKRREVLYI